MSEKERKLTYRRNILDYKGKRPMKFTLKSGAVNEANKLFDEWNKEFYQENETDQEKLFKVLSMEVISNMYLTFYFNIHRSNGILHIKKTC